MGRVAGRRQDRIGQRIRSVAGAAQYDPALIDVYRSVDLIHAGSENKRASYSIRVRPACPHLIERLLDPCRVVTCDRCKTGDLGNDWDWRFPIFVTRVTVIRDPVFSASE